MFPEDKDLYYLILFHPFKVANAEYCIRYFNTD